MPNSYKTSHSSKDYGKIYSKTYENGYYAYQWQHIEKPLLETIFINAINVGAKKYLDFACGTGRILNIGEKHFENSIGVDVSEPMLVEARNICINSKILQRDITENNIDEKFDVITAFRFFLNAENTLSKNVLYSLREIIKDNGILIANVHVNKFSPLGFLYTVRNKIKGKTVANTMSFREFEQLLIKNGFEIQSVYWYSYFPRLGWNFGKISRFLMLPTETLFSKIPILSTKLSQSFLVVAKKR